MIRRTLNILLLLTWTILATLYLFLIGTSALNILIGGLR